jgi:hypothetical protein
LINAGYLDLIKKQASWLDNSTVVSIGASTCRPLEGTTEPLYLLEKASNTLVGTISE